MSDKKISDLGTTVFPVTAEGVDTLHPSVDLPDGVHTLAELQEFGTGKEVYAKIEKMNHTEGDGN
jgi:hypothetical protein